MRLDPFRPALDPTPVLGSDWKPGLPPERALEPDRRIAARWRRRAAIRARREGRVRRGAAEYPSPGVAAVDVAMPDRPTCVVLRTPVPPAGVPSELLGAVVLGVPPAGPLRAPPGVTWAKEGATAMAARTAAAISEVERRRDRMAIRSSGREGQDGMPCRSATIRRTKSCCLDRPPVRPLLCGTYAASLSCLRSLRLRWFGSRNRLRSRTADGVTSTSSSSSI